MFYLPDMLQTHSMTAKEVEENAVIWDGNTSERIQLHEKEDYLTFLGEEVRPALHPVLITEETAYPKTICIFAGALYKLSAEDDLWHYSDRYRRVELKTVGDTVDMIVSLSEDLGVRWHRFLGTDDPELEQPSVKDLSWKEDEGKAVVCGALMFAERLHIPSQIHGMPVHKVYLPDYSRNTDLRELVVEEGVGQIYVDLSGYHLETIEIPDSIHLINPPTGITSTAWYRKQPEGDVYFHGYYCGTVGTPETVTLRDGTVGITAGASAGKMLRELTIPASVTYIGMGAFLDSCQLEKVHIPDSSAHLLNAFWTFPRIIPRIRDDGEPKISLWELNQHKIESGFDLYQLGRSSPQARCLIPTSCEPIAPKLTYTREHGWKAEFWYMSEKDVAYYLSLQVPSGAVIEKRTFTGYLRHWDCWTPDHVPVYYYLGETYLEQCVLALANGVPDQKTLDRLEERWKEQLPNRLCRWFSEQAAEKRRRRREKRDGESMP